MMIGGEAWLGAAIDYIARHQERDGGIPWWTGSPLDPWDHVESAMALDVGGRHADAERAYRFLAERQLEDGSLCSRYRRGEAEDRTKDTNVSTYLAVGVWHHFRVTGDRRFLRAMWPMVERSIEFALALQADHGGVYWACDEDDNVWEDCLVTGCSSIRASILCGERIARVLGESHDRRWQAKRARLEDAIRGGDEIFGWSWGNEKDRFAMDWYYPILTGVIGGEEARERISVGNERFVEDQWGCRCRDDQPWYTIAESAELALALDSCGRTSEAQDLLSWQLTSQDPDGGFRTGTVPDYGPWPDEERPTWTAAAVVLAADALCSLTPASDLFRSLHVT